MRLLGQEKIEFIRQFNRSYTASLGVLGNTYLGTSRFLTEIRILYEIQQHSGCFAREIGKTLRLNEGYISRIIKKMEQLGFLIKEKSPQDGRSYHLYLTDQGEAQVDDLSRKAAGQIRQLLEGISPQDQQRLVDAMRIIEDILNI